MQRYFAQKCDLEGNIYITGSDYFHIVTVMRGKLGDEVYVVVDGITARAKIINISKENVKLGVIEWSVNSNELQVNVILACALTKGSKWETIVQKGTELGASTFIPWEGQRTVTKWDTDKKRKKQERYQKIAREAAEQSYRSIIPQVMPVTNLSTVLDKYTQSVDIKIVADEESSKNGEVKNFARLCQTILPAMTVIIVTGPEGGFAREEIHKLVNNGFVRCGLGKRILRAETAPLFITSAISYEQELRSYTSL